MQRALLRHLLAMTPYVAAEERLCSQLISRLVALWSSGEEEVRVLAFVNMYRLTRRNQAALLDTVLMVRWGTLFNSLCLCEADIRHLDGVLSFSTDYGPALCNMVVMLDCHIARWMRDECE